MTDIHKVFQSTKILLAIAFAFTSTAFGLPSRPEKSHVYDENRVVPAQQLEFFDNLSMEIAKETGISIDAVLLDDIGERVASQYASDIAEKWKADAGLDGEILIFVAQKQRRKFIVTKGSASGILDDATIKKLDQEAIDRIITPMPQHYQYWAAEYLKEQAAAAPDLSLD